MSPVYQIIILNYSLRQYSKKMNDQHDRIYNMKRSTSGWNAMIVTRCAVNLNGITDVIQVDVLLDRSSTWFGDHPRASYQLMPWISSNETCLERFDHGLSSWNRPSTCLRAFLQGLDAVYNTHDDAFHACFEFILGIQPRGVHPTTNYKWLY